MIEITTSACVGGIVTDIFSDGDCGFGRQDLIGRDKAIREAVQFWNEIKFKDIAERLDLTVGRISQIHLKATRLLKIMIDVKTEEINSPLFKILTENEREILFARYKNEVTIQDMSKKFKISEDEIRKKIKAIFRKLLKKE